MTVPAHAPGQSNPAGIRRTHPVLVDFNTLLKCANLCVLTLIAAAFGQLEGNEYVDQVTILLGVLLCVQTHVALILERGRRDPFVILLAFAMIFFFELRVFTLALYPSSTVFERYSYDATDSNRALVFILAANLFIYAGLLFVRIRHGCAILAAGWRGTSPGSVVMLIVIAIVFAYFGNGYWTADNVPRVFNFLVSFLSPGIVLLMTLAYYMLFRRSLGGMFARVIAVLIALDIVVHTLSGSRSAVMFFVQNCMFAALAIAGCIRIPRKYVILGVALLPVLVAAMVASFAISTYNRLARAGAASLDIGAAFENAGEAARDIFAGPNLDLLITPVVSRAGYFDFSAEVIAHRDEYRSVLNLASYGRSFIDNILTPGFDLFDQPKISNALQFTYRDWGEPSKRDVNEFYQSDQFGIYGEFFALFGWFSLPLLFLTATGLKSAYAAANSPNPFVFAMKRIVVLYVFARLIDSFGIDWIVAEVIPLVVAIVLYAYFFRARPSTPESRLDGRRIHVALSS